MTQVWVGVLLIKVLFVQKILPIYQKGRFYQSASKIGQRIWGPSVYMYAQSFVHRLFHKQKPPIIIPFDLPEEGDFCLAVGHATFLMRLGGITILTDPIFESATFLFRRAVSPGITIDRLPPVDYVLISHNHRDHLDERSIKQIVSRSPHVTFLVPQGVREWFLHLNIERVHEYIWWDSYKISGFACTFLPAYHWSGRWLTDKNRSLWGSWMIEAGGRTIYFAGDTAYWKHFLCIGHYFPNIDMALLPIGPCKPHKYMQTSHLNAASAIQAFIELRARYFVAMHWGVFYFGTDDIFTPIEYLERAWKNKQHQLQRIHTIVPAPLVLIPGQSILLDMLLGSKPVSSTTQISV